MISTFPFSVEAIFRIVSWFVAGIADDLRQVRLWLLDALSFVLPGKLLSLSFLHVCSKSKVFLKNRTSSSVDFAFLMQTIVPKLLKGWLDSTAIDSNQK